MSHNSFHFVAAVMYCFNNKEGNRSSFKSKAFFETLNGCLTAYKQGKHQECGYIRHPIFGKLSTHHIKITMLLRYKQRA